MNAAARLVIALLGMVAIGTVATLCVIALKTSEGKDVKEIAVFALGALSGVLAKVGYDVLKDMSQPKGTPDDPVSTEEVKP